ncbi:Cd2+/Zn2+-exporting ATPase [Lachnospiraceae bacterium NK3A20]|nr:Cd2+/Zn2+-exporting ATPase [Lachnospiraceae bacterium NK3A20]
MRNWTKKQRRTLYRIIVVLLCFVTLLILDHTGVLEPLPAAVVFLLYFIPYLIIGYDVILRAFRNLAHGQVFDEHFLMMIATLAAFGLGLMGGGSYSEALAVMLFYQIGELFQSIAVGRSRESITQLMSIAPDYANLLQDGKIEEVDPDEVHAGDIIVIRPGEKIPLDGSVLEGESYLDTAALTGESVPRRVRVGEEVISGCVNGDGTLQVRVSKEYEDSTVAKILDLVENASDKKSRMENFITRFARIYTPVVTVGAILLAILPPMLFGWSFAESIRRACNFLIVSCPCALVISVPLGFFGGIGAASRIGVLVKGSNFLEAASRLSTVVMDKTGTLTKGEFRVQKVLPAFTNTLDLHTDEYPHETPEEMLLRFAAYGEGYSTHPIAQSIREAYGKSVDLSKLSGAREIAGGGIEILLDQKKLLVGNEKLMQDNSINYRECDEPGTIVYVAYNGAFIGSIVISDTVKEGAAAAIAQMKTAGVTNTVMLTGDRSASAGYVADSLGIDSVYAELLPQDKVRQVEQLLRAEEREERGKKLAFVGDGINDAPVLMRSDVGIAMGALGSDAAIEAADIVLMDDDIRKIPAIIRIAKKTMRIVRANVCFAIGVKLLILILSVFGLVGMWAAVFGDVGVAILCILNSMRMLREGPRQMKSL